MAFDIGATSNWSLIASFPNLREQCIFLVFYFYLLLFLKPLGIARERISKLQSSEKYFVNQYHGFMKMKVERLHLRAYSCKFLATFTTTKGFS